MTEAARIADLFARAFEGEAWHGPSLKELLAGVTAEAAARRPITNAHSIWEIVLHVTAWHEAVRRRLRGEPVRELPEERNWPTVTDAGEPAWRRAVADLERGSEALRDAIAALPPERLHESLAGVERDWSVYLTLHGIIQHDLYHAGQIALLKK